MPTSGLVLTAQRADDVPTLLAALAARSGVEVGLPTAGRIPLVTETTSKEEDKKLWDWLWELPGVAMLDVAFIHLGEGHMGEGHLREGHMGEGHMGEGEEPGGAEASGAVPHSGSATQRIRHTADPPHNPSPFRSFKDVLRKSSHES